MLVPSPTQGTAVRDWVVDSINRDDLGVLEVPAPFPVTPINTVVWAGQDYPRADRYVVLTPISITSRHNMLNKRQEASDVGDPGQALREVRHEWREWALGVQVASTLASTARSLGDTAGVWLQRVVGSFTGEAVVDLGAVGVAPLRRGEIVDLARLQSGTQWETRASITLTFLCGWTASRSIDWVNRATGEGTVPPLAPLPFDSDLGSA